MKAILYIRVSSKDQAKEGYSLDAQEKLAYEYAHRNNLDIVRHWKVSESAWKNERVAFNQLVEYAKRHKDVTHIIFDALDRMTRNDFDKLKIYRLIKEHGKTIHFSRTNKIFNQDSGSDDEFMLDIEVAVAKKMSNDISRKTKMGMQEKAEQGIYPSVAPMGYINSPERALEIDSTQAPFVKRAFYLSGYEQYSIRMIENTLYNEGFRSKRNMRVQKTAIFKLLKNPLYYGMFLWNGKLYKGTHTPIISKTVFDKVNKAKTKPEKRIYKNKFAFNNLMRCGVCGCKIVGERRKGKFTYYHCTFSKGRHEGGDYIREENIPPLFEQSLKNISITPEIASWLQQELRKKLEKNTSTRSIEAGELKKQKTKIQSRLSSLFDMRADGEISEYDYKIKHNEYKTILMEIDTKLNAKTPNITRLCNDAQKIFELANRLYPLYLSANNDKKAEILKIVSSNYLLQNLSLCPTYRKPFSFMAKGPSRTFWLPREDSNLGQSG